MPSIKEIYNTIGEVELNADQINLNTDGLEALAATQQADIALIKSDVDDIRVDMANGVSVSGSVSVSNFPATQTVAGTVTASLADVATNDVFHALPHVRVNGGLGKGVELAGIDSGGGQVPIWEGGGIPVYPRDNTDANAPFPVAGTVTADSNRGTLSQPSAPATLSITTAATSQQVFASNASRKYLVVQNLSDTVMYLGVGFTPNSSTPQGLLLSANGGGIVFESNFIPTEAVNIVCATAGKRFQALEG
jgi:hypothetical protein